MEIHPIKTEMDYQRALQEIERLFDATPNTPAGDRLDVLTTLVEVYEDKHQYTLPFPDPIEAIAYHLGSRGLSEDDLTQYIGNHDLVRDVLQKKYPLSIEMIRKLHNGLGISADILIRPYSLRQEAA